MKQVVGLVLLFVLSGNAMGEERQAVILMYHHFGVDEHPSTNVRLAQFDAHLDYLAKAGYEIWPLEKVVTYLKGQQAFPTRVVAITVDDAYDSVYTQAFPRLRARGWPFTVFVATDGVDKQFQAYMSWDQIREMHQHGVTFANHSATHDYLIRHRPGETEAQWATRISEDIRRAQRRLQEELGSAPALFAYPYGEYDTALANIVADQGYVAFGQHSGPAGLTDDLRALPRFPMAEAFADMSDFRIKLASLAFPLDKVEPWDPVVPSSDPPQMIVTLGKSDARLDELTCYFSAQGQMKIQWLDHQARRFSVQPDGTLPVGRSRYNCTAPSLQQNRYYWFSHLWIWP